MDMPCKKSQMRPIYILFIIFCCFSCKEQKSDTIRIGVLNGPTAISFIQLIDKPLMIDGKRTEIIFKSDPQQIQALMMRNELDFAVLPTVMAANLYNKDVDFKIVAIPVWGTLYLLSNQPGIKSFADLEGQTISVFGQGATPDILLQRYIEYNQLNAVKIDYSYSGNSDLAHALLHKKVKIAVLSEPLVSSLLARDSTIKMISKLDCEYFFHNSNVDIFAQTSFLVNSKFIEDYDAEIHKLTEAYAQSCNFVNEEPEKAIDLLLKHKLIMDRTEARIALPLCNIHYVGAFAVERELMEYLNIFYEYSPKSIGGKLPPRNIIYQP